MPTPGPLSDQEAAHRRRAWLASRRRWNHDLILVVLRYAPETDVARALDQLPAGELQQLARQLTQATDLRQVARGILVDLQEHLDGHSAAPDRQPANLGRDHPDALTTHLRGRPITLDHGRWELHPGARAVSGEGARGRASLPRHTGYLARPGSGGAGVAGCPRVKRDGTAGLVGCCIKPPPKAAPPSRRVRPPASIALDRDPVQPPARRPQWVAGEGRAFGACCFAGKLRSPAHASGDAATRPVFRAAAPTSFPTSIPTSFPTRWGCVPMVSLADRISAGHSPFVGPVSRKNRG
jgi:hypothetical protein